MSKRKTILLAAALSIGMIAGAIPTAGATTGAGNALKTWALENENPNPTRTRVPLAQALRDAKSFDVITAHPVDYGGEVTQMKAVNPNLVLLAYQNATFAQKGQANAFPESWYEHDAKGKRVINPGTGNLLMVPTNPLWIQNRTKECQKFLTQSGYDGCYLDMLGLAPLVPGYLSAFPVNPATGQLWTKPDWLAATASLAAQVRSAVHPQLLFGNGLSDGSHFFDPTAPTEQIVDGMDGGVAEAWLRNARQPATVYPNQTVWKQNVDMIGVVEAEGKPMLSLTKLWVTATPAQQQAWLQYALASFLLGTQGRSSFFFSDSPTVSRTTTFPWYKMALGAPSGSYALVSGVYQRHFATGLALVNPGTMTVRVDLGGTYYTVNRQKITSVTMTPDSGVILTTR